MCVQYNSKMAAENSSRVTLNRVGGEHEASVRIPGKLSYRLGGHAG